MTSVLWAISRPFILKAVVADMAQQYTIIALDAKWPPIRRGDL